MITYLHTSFITHGIIHGRREPTSRVCLVSCSYFLPTTFRALRVSPAYLTNPITPSQLETIVHVRVLISDWLLAVPQHGLIIGNEGKTHQACRAPLQPACP